MQFRPDANTHTGFAEMVNDVLLPKSDLVMVKNRQFVPPRIMRQGAFLLQEETEEGRGLVLAEKRGRGFADYRTFISALRKETP